MLSIAFVLAASVLVTSASPTPEINSSLTRIAARNDKVVCGTTQDADLAACQSILDNWSGTLVESNVCHFGGDWQGDNRAWNVASVPGCECIISQAWAISLKSQ
jgi:hypothetical protein